ncbi:hypothetical protein RCL1_003640 [Eukaryota sp. TZLM3-RCL]
MYLIIIEHLILLFFHVLLAVVSLGCLRKSRGKHHFYGSLFCLAFAFVFTIRLLTDIILHSYFRDSYDYYYYHIRHYFFPIGQVLLSLAYGNIFNRFLRLSSSVTTLEFNKLKSFLVLIYAFTFLSFFLATFLPFLFFISSSSAVSYACYCLSASLFGWFFAGGFVYAYRALLPYLKPKKSQSVFFGLNVTVKVVLNQLARVVGICVVSLSIQSIALIYKAIMLLRDLVEDVFLTHFLRILFSLVNILPAMFIVNTLNNPVVSSNDLIKSLLD